MQGQRPPERTCLGVSGGADRLTAGSLARQAGHHWEGRKARNGGHTSGTVVVSMGMGPVIGAALPGKLDGLQWSASTGLLLSSLCFAPEISEPQSPVFMHCKTASKEPQAPVRSRVAVSSHHHTRRSPPPAASGTWHVLALTPVLSPDWRMPFLRPLAGNQYEL